MSNLVIKKLAALCLSFTLALASFLGIAVPVVHSAETLSTWNFAGFTGIVVGDVCNLRLGPSTSSQIVAQVTRGTVLEIQEQLGDWLKVTYGSQTCWIASHLVDIDLRTHGVTAKVTHDDVNIRRGPGLEYQVLASTSSGSIFQALALRKDWVKVSVPGLIESWIYAPLLKLEFPSISGEPQSNSSMKVFATQAPVTVRQTPVKGSASIGTIPLGGEARYISARGAWIAVELPAGTRGWVFGPEVRVVSDADPDTQILIGETSWSAGKLPSTTVTASDVNFRQGPGTSYPVLTLLQKGDKLQVIDSQNGWFHAINPSGLSGYVASWLTSGTTQSSGFSLTLTHTGSCSQISITGSFSGATLSADPDGMAIRIKLSGDLNSNVFFEPNAYEFKKVQISGQDIVISLLERSNYTVVQNTPGKLCLQFSPLVTGVDLVTSAENETVKLSTLGYVWPAVSRTGSSVSIRIPGAAFLGTGTSKSGNIVKSLMVNSAGSDVLLTLNTQGTSPFYLTRSPNALEAHFPSPGLAGKTIVIDPGHGGSDPGARGYSGIREDMVNWDIAVRLAEMLRQQGANPVLTRASVDSNTIPPQGWQPSPDEYSGELAKRVAWSKDAHLFISIHSDWHQDRMVNGSTVYICSKTLNASESSRLGAIILEEMQATAGTGSRGVRDSNFYVVRETAIPAVLVETMYLSNPQDEAKLMSEQGRQAVALALLKAVQRYFGQVYR